MSDILIIGELLAEFMATEIGQPFDAPGKFQGPFPSGAPGIFADQAALMGRSVSFIGCVGADRFGEMIIRRLAIDGVDTSSITRTTEVATGVAFVRYFKDNSREFIFHIGNSAAGKISRDEVTEPLTSSCKFLHVMGSYLGSEQAIEVILHAVKNVRNAGGKISFDPNIRPELMGLPAARSAIDFVINNTSILLPSESDLNFLRPGLSENAGARELLATYPTIDLIAAKRGQNGAAYYDRTTEFAIAGHEVVEIDPTGAGDCFGATFLSCIIRGDRPREALLNANLAGAHAVTVRGPMEGNSTEHQLERFRSLLLERTEERNRARNQDLQP